MRNGPSEHDKTHSKETKVKREDRQTEPGLVTFYDTWLGNGVGLFIAY